MTTTVPLPPDEEATRQQMVHTLRMERLALARHIHDRDFTPVGHLNRLVMVNVNITLLEQMRKPFPSGLPEPSLKEIEARGLDWFWEEWREDDEIDTDTL